MNRLLLVPGERVRRGYNMVTRLSGEDEKPLIENEQLRYVGLLFGASLCPNRTPNENRAGLRAA